MSDPWWFRGRRFTEQVDQLDASGRAAVIAAVGRSTRWYRWFAVAAVTASMLAALAVAIHDFLLVPDGAEHWYRSLSPFIMALVFSRIGLNERVDLVTSREVRSYRQRDLRTEIATLLATRPS